ncbi:Nucleotide-binding universal stress protein, UspA family [Desulfonatronum thiosulfatophilum]|uniref:Nucleotide-binding universal stress protein, UspA family n=1 Tax=Desulfonatronum thiosulfatophilum TaxID=617002 RepID=A0A1G6CJE2_9BACT|nr:universal stress protein [Desulfonatronum thiosulfatophilum]SDB33019.1 Nucleotide-binding universal stress protein, UspA family [Desulfonatronum thiosulfatophilum]
MNLKKILVAVDASENSTRAVDYVGAMIGSSPGFAIQLLYVERNPERDTFPDDAAWKKSCEQEEKKMREYLDQARDALQGHGVASKTVSTEYYVPTFNAVPSQTGFKSPLGVADHILRVIREGDFGTVVVGRRGMSKAEEFLFGSVSTKIVHNTKNCTVWVVE